MKTLKKIHMSNTDIRDAIIAYLNERHWPEPGPGGSQQIRISLQCDTKTGMFTADCELLEDK